MDFVRLDEKYHLAQIFDRIERNIANGVEIERVKRWMERSIKSIAEPGDQEKMLKLCNKWINYLIRYPPKPEVKEEQTRMEGIR